MGKYAIRAVLALAPVLRVLGREEGFTSSQRKLLSTAPDNNPERPDSSALVCPALTTLCREHMSGLWGPLVYGLLLGERSLLSLLWLDHCWLPAIPRGKLHNRQPLKKKSWVCPSKCGDIHGRHYGLMESFSTSSFLGNLIMY